MSRVIVGYSFEKKKTPWPIIIIAVIILAILMLWYVLSGQNQPSEKKVSPKPTVTTPTTIAAATTTSTIVKAATTTIKVEKLKQEAPKKLPAGTVKMLTAKRIEDHQVKDFAVDFAPGERVYCFTSVALDSLPREIYHEWIGPDGGRYAVVELRISNLVADSWSYISLPPGSQGKWTVRTVVNQKEVGKTTFRVK